MIMKKKALKTKNKVKGWFEIMKIALKVLILTLWWWVFVVDALYTISEILPTNYYEYVHTPEFLGQRQVFQYVYCKFNQEVFHL